MPLLDTDLQSVEVLRYTSHVRDYSAGEWLRQVSEAGLHTRSTTRQRLRLEYQSWVERMRTPAVMRGAIREMQRSMGVEIGREACRERVCTYGSLSVVARSLKKNTSFN